MQFTKNYHTHTYRCQHASGDVIDYAREALAQGATVLGMSDHAALPDNRWQSVRMTFDQLEEYEQAIQTAREAYPQLQILKGMECEYAPEYESYMREELLDKRQYDYLIGAAHFVPVDGEWLVSFDRITSPKAIAAYSEYVIKMMQSGLFAFIAHPDVFGSCNDEWNADLEACSRDILEAAQDLNMPLEINGYGFRKPHRQTPNGSRPIYPWRPFWEVASDYNIKAICNSDAHRPQDVMANLDDCLQLAESLGIETVELN